MSADFKKLTQIWAAKNVPFDRIGLRVPSWDVSLRFLECEEVDVFKFITATRYSHFRKYSTDQEDCRPLESLDLFQNKEQITSCKIVGATSPLGNAMTTDFDNIEFLTTDIRRDIYHFNGKGHLLRKIGKGDITGFANCIETQGNYIIQGGLDRYVRLFDSSTYQLIGKVFTGGKISDLTLLDDTDLTLPLTEQEKKKLKKKEQKRKLTEHEEDAENDDLWDELEANPSKKKKKKAVK